MPLIGSASEPLGEAGVVGGRPEEGRYLRGCLCRPHKGDAVGSKLLYSVAFDCKSGGGGLSTEVKPAAAIMPGVAAASAVVAG